MDCTVNQRLRKFIEKKNISQRDIQVSLGLKNEQSISNWMRLDEQIPDKYLPTLIRKNPSLNANWLLKGMGEMEDNTLSTVQDPEKIYDKAKEDLKDQLLQNQTDRINELKEAITKLNGQIAFLQHIIETQCLIPPLPNGTTGEP